MYLFLFAEYENWETIYKFKKIYFFCNHFLYSSVASTSHCFHIGFKTGKQISKKNQKIIKTMLQNKYLY